MATALNRKSDRYSADINRRDLETGISQNEEPKVEAIRRSINARIQAVSPTEHKAVDAAKKQNSDAPGRLLRTVLPQLANIREHNDVQGIKSNSLGKPSELFATPESLARNNLPQITFVVLKEWEGFVEEFDQESVYVRLLDIRSKNIHETEYAEIPLVEFSPSDRLKLKKGAIFRWAIGLQKRGTTQQRLSSIILRDLPMWSIREIDNAKRIGSQLSQDINKTRNDDEITSF